MVCMLTADVIGGTFLVLELIGVILLSAYEEA